MSNWHNAANGTQFPGIYLRKFRRTITFVVVACVLLWILNTLASSSSSSSPSSSSSTHSNGPVGAHQFPSQAADTHPDPLDPSAQGFWRAFSNAIARGKPSFNAVRRNNNDQLWIVFDRYRQPYPRPDRIDMTTEEVDEMKKLNDRAIKDMLGIAPNLPFVRGTRGIVTTASNNAFAILTTSLIMLRYSGSQLPVEVWLESHENYERAACDEIYPSLGAKCLFMEDYLPANLDHPLHMVKFTYKTLSMVFSSFEQILFLDCDAFPVMNPDSIFETEPFTSHGLVVWPDYWVSTASHHLYDIIGSAVPNMTYRATSESGQLLVNKATHAATLLLVQFYNTYGDSHWYPLLSQGAPGEGDKDTYVLAAENLKAPFYQLWSAPERVGYRCEGNKRPLGSGQAHPRDDYMLWQRGVYMQEDGFQMADRIAPRILFVHGNLPKYDAHILLDWLEPPSEWPDLVRCNRGLGEVHRMWGDKDIMTMKFGWDVEKALWDAIRWTVCEHENGFKTWLEASIFHPNVRANACQETVRLWRAIFPNEKWQGLQIPASRAEQPWHGFARP